LRHVSRSRRPDGVRDRNVLYHYGPEKLNRRVAVAWWDWPLERITRHVRTIMSGSVDALEAAA
jgi:virginiamycin A acetyltransferase